MVSLLEKLGKIEYQIVTNMSDGTSIIHYRHNVYRAGMYQNQIDSVRKFPGVQSTTVLRVVPL